MKTAKRTSPFADWELFLGVGDLSRHLIFLAGEVLDVWSWSSLSED